MESLKGLYVHVESAVDGNLGSLHDHIKQNRPLKWRHISGKRRPQNSHWNFHANIIRNTEF